jgi:hypothetical protein
VIKKTLPKIGRPVEKPSIDKLESMSRWDPLREEAMAITKRYEGTKNWGDKELRTIFNWMDYPERLDFLQCYLGGSDFAAVESVDLEQGAFAQLFAAGPDLLEPLLALRKLFVRRTKQKNSRDSKYAQEAMRLGRRNDVLKIWNRAMRKSGKPEVPMDHFDEIFNEKAGADRSIEKLRAYLRKLVSTFPQPP